MIDDYYHHGRRDLNNSIVPFNGLFVCRDLKKFVIRIGYMASLKINLLSTLK